MAEINFNNYTVDELKKMVKEKNIVIEIPVKQRKKLDYVNAVQQFYEQDKIRRIESFKTNFDKFINRIKKSELATLINTMYRQEGPIVSNIELFNNLIRTDEFIIQKRNEIQTIRIEDDIKNNSEIVLKIREANDVLNTLYRRKSSILSQKLDISNRDLRFEIPPPLRDPGNYHISDIACPPHITGGGLTHSQNLILFIICNPFLNDSQKFTLLLNCLYYRYKSGRLDEDHKRVFTEVYKIAFRFYSYFYRNTVEEFTILLKAYMGMLNINDYFSNLRDLNDIAVLRINRDVVIDDFLTNSYIEYLRVFPNINQISNIDLVNNLTIELLQRFNRQNSVNFRGILTNHVIALGNHINNNGSLDNDEKLRRLERLPRSEFINNLIGHLIFHQRLNDNQKLERLGNLRPITDYITNLANQIVNNIANDINNNDRLDNYQKLERLSRLQPRTDYIINLANQIVNNIANSIMNDQTLDFDKKLRRLQTLEPRTDYIKSTINDINNIIASNINNNDRLDNYQKLERLSRLQPITEYINNLINNIDGILIFEDRRLNNNQKLERLQRLQPPTDYINLLIANLRGEQSPMRKKTPIKKSKKR